MARETILRSAFCAVLAGALLLRGGETLAASSAPAPAQPAEAGGAVSEPGTFSVEGFRSARWGMTEAEVKAAIQKDFGTPPAQISTSENDTERTTVLAVTVADLIDGAGAARLSYILGYKTKKLIQVTILWGTPVDPRVPPERIVTAANQLRQLLLDSGYQPKTIVANAPLANGSILVFEGEDIAKHMTVLRLASTPSRAKGSQNKAGVASIALSLSYVQDSRSPDIFRLKKGQF